MEIQRSLQQTLADKRAGLHELDHRVRNNIQVMMSLTNLAEHDPSPEALSKLRLRVDSMATVQQLIDPAGNAVDIDVSLLTFRTYQKVQAAVPQRRCEFEWVDGRPPEAIYLPANSAVQLALACTEIFMNSLQHADATTVVRIRAGVSVSGTLLRLELSDNGSAVSADVDYLSHPGLTLIQAAVEQCGGKVKPSAQAGFTHVVTIPLVNNTELHG
jgi:two-component sensor histidine kinase